MGCQSDDNSQPVSGSAARQQRSTECSPTAAPQRHQDQQHQHEEPEEGKDKQVHPTPSEPSSKKAPRRFLAQPVETSSRSSQPSTQQPSTSNPASANQSQSPPPVHDNPTPPRRRFLPEPIETTKTSNSNSTKPRRFKPEIIETEQRSVQGKLDVPLSNRHNARTRGGHLEADPEAARLRTRLSPNRTISHPTESKFSYASLLRRQEQSRRHSFRVPELPSIPSNSSEDSDADSEALSFSPAPEKQNDSQSAKSQQNNNGNKRSFQDSSSGEGDGEGGGFSDYLLSVAARSAHQQLKDQALAAFPNEQVYQHYDHFAIDGDEGPSRDEKEEDEDEYDRDWMYPPKHHLKSRRQSSADLSWELEYMRHHKEEAEQRFRVMKRKPDLRLSGPRIGERKNLGPTPPMLGMDIILPQSTSPVGTFSNNNGTTQTETETDACSGCGTLWCGPTRPNMARGSGLWMGTCQKDEAEADNHGNQMMTGIMTPMLRAGTGSGSESGSRPSPSFSPDPRSRREEPSSTHTHTHTVPRSAPGHSRNPSRNTNTNTNTSPNLSLNLTPSKPIEEEFNDSFVTQIYNYLSLGYPCVARYYDHELSKISGIKISELRQDDLHTDAKGYVMAPEPENGNSNSSITDAEIKPGSDASATSTTTVACTRWKALRLYIQEWARQQPNMADEKKWGVGVPERRGSWAF